MGLTPIGLPAVRLRGGASSAEGRDDRSTPETMIEQMESNGDRIAAIAEAHDLSRDTVRAVVEDLQEGAENPQVCESCGATANAEEDRFVGRVPLADGSEGVRCATCFVELLDSETTLSTGQATVLGYLYMTDLTRREISRITDLASVGTHRTRGMKKIVDARESNSETVPPILEAIEHEV